jgi:RHS repeat-associated protein
MSPPSVSLPKGGGAIRGLGEKFGTNPVTGTASLSIPILTSAGRSDFGPQLSLSYDSGAGNGPFGFGWHLSAPSITRKTAKGLPRYRDDADSDVFILSDAEDLVPVLTQHGAEWRPATFERTLSGVRYCIQRYRPRVEGLFARIERWTNMTSGEIHWRSISRDNVLTVYGRTGDSRISDPTDPVRTFSWLICESCDDKGNVIVYEYKRDNDRGVDVDEPHERHRTSADRSANRYLKRIKYGNRTPHFRESASIVDDFMFEVVFDYGEHDATPTPHESRPWICRRDAFSSYRSGFEIRTYRLCQRVLMFHHFPREIEVGSDCLVNATVFTYRTTDIDPDGARIGGPVASFIADITRYGFRRSGGEYVSHSLPPLTLEYSEAVVHEHAREIDGVSLDNLPYGLDGDTYRWTDLDGEGVSGILSEQAGAWFFKRNLGGGRFGPISTLPQRPSMSAASSGGPQLLDLAGDGQLDFVTFGTVPGFFERTADGGWDVFRSFRTLPNVNWDDPNVRFVDLDGDGLADVLVSDNDVCRWYPSLAEEGFGQPNVATIAGEEVRGSRLLFADREQSLYLADMSGDGLTDLVRVRNGEICYWPNLGYGRFGVKVTMSRSPRLDAPDLFDQRRVRLADIDGSGTTDLIYLGTDGVTLYSNQSGNSWSAAHRLAAFPHVDQLSSVFAVDLLGNGTACLVWSSPLPGDASRPMRYIDLMGGQKPHLLVRTSNNLGAEMRLTYAPSTRFYLADREAGAPWITRLPFPVHVVERVETYDHISGSRFVTRFAYHHGFFDGIEREFRGFGRIDQWDTEEFATLTAGGAGSADNGVAAPQVPPVWTRTWFDTGAWNPRDLATGGSTDVAREYYRAPAAATGGRPAGPNASLIPPNLPAEEEREARRALKGTILRREIYGRDGSTVEGIPFTANEQNYVVRRLQPRGPRHPGCFLVHAREALTHSYERRPSDPRITHVITLEVDNFGNTLREVAIGYGRAAIASDPSLMRQDSAVQSQVLITYTEHQFTNLAESADHYRLPLLADARTYELTGYTPALDGARFSVDDWSLDDFAPLASAEEVAYETQPTPGKRCKRLIEHVRTQYRADDLGTVLPVGRLEPLGLHAATYKLALTPGLIRRYARRGSDGRDDSLLPADPGALLEGRGGDDGGYVAIDGSWWITSGRVFLDPAVDVGDSTHTAARELETARAHFFLPRMIVDPFGHSTIVDYDPYDLFVSRSADTLANSTAIAHDYRTGQPRCITDPNRNRTAVAFDALGRVVATAVMGKEAENAGDELEDFSADLSLREIQQFVRDPAARAAAVLGRATSYIVYDSGRFWRTQQPPLSATILRETHFHAANEAPSALQISFSYSDGFGRETQRKTQAAAGPAPARGHPIALPDGDVAPGGLLGRCSPSGTPRWIGSGRVVFNNKGKPIRQYQPFFSATHLYEAERDLTDAGPSTLLFYDPLLRVVATLQPNNTYEKVVFDAWSQAVFDVHDTVAPRGRETGDPRTDPDVAGYVHGYFRRQTADWQPWYVERIGKPAGDPEFEAARTAAIHTNTPTVVHFDTLGRPVLTVAHNRRVRDGELVDERYLTRTDLDIEGNVRGVVDACQRLTVRYEHDMLGRRIYQHSMDAGERWLLHDVANKPIRAWSSRGHDQRVVYDVLRRATHVYVAGNGRERLHERIDYGESKGDAANHRTRVYQHRDAAGIATTEAYDFKGNVLESRRDVLADYKNAADWQQTLDISAGGYISRATYDALNRTVTATSPDGSIYRPTFNSANLLEQIEVRHRGSATATPFVTHIDYDAKGQRTRIGYGNGTETQYRYDPLMLRLVGLRTIRPAGAETFSSPLLEDPRLVQDLRYTYDAVGNLTRSEDEALCAIFHGGEHVRAVCRYEYDALYRLIEARGREHIGQATLDVDPPAGDHRDYPFAGVRVHANDSQALRNYTESYDYDAVGNILVLQHSAAHGYWTRRYHYEGESPIEPSRKSNRLTRSAIGDGLNRIDRYAHDQHGNITTMPHLHTMMWDCQDQLCRVDLQGGGTAYYTYSSNGLRVRKVVETHDGRLREDRIYLAGFETCREYDDTGRSVARSRESLHVMDDKQRIAIVDTVAEADHAPGAAPSIAHRYQLANYLGSTSVELDQDAALISYEDYHPFGTSSFQAGRTVVEVRLKRYRYTGKGRDEETGFNYHGARHYAPWLGRWTSCDPASLRDYPRSNGAPYTYVQNRPTIAIDPNGELIWFLAAAVVVAVVATPQIANAPAPGQRTYTRSTADLALSMAENAVMIYAAPRILAGGATLIAKEGIIKGGATFLGYVGAGYGVAHGIQSVANLVDPSGYLGRSLNLTLAMYLLRPRTAAPTEGTPPPEGAPAAAAESASGGTPAPRTQSQGGQPPAQPPQPSTAAPAAPAPQVALSRQATAAATEAASTPTRPSTAPAEGPTTGPSQNPAATNDTVSVYHGSINDASAIRAQGLDPTKAPAWASRDLSAAKEAIGPNRYEVQMGAAKDPGIVESRVPRAEFERVMRPHERPYSGFSGGLSTTEIVLRTVELIALFNKYIVKTGTQR